MKATEVMAVAAQVAQTIRNTRRDLREVNIDVKRRIAAGHPIEDFTVTEKGVRVPRDGVKTIAQNSASWFLVNLGKVENVLSDANDRAELDAYLRSWGRSVEQWEAEVAELKALAVAYRDARKIDAVDLVKAADDTIAATPRDRTLEKLY